jgi:hypothetical protein
LATDFDFLEAIFSLSHSFKINFGHVEGHKENEIAFDEATLDAQLKVEVTNWQVRHTIVMNIATVPLTLTCRATGACAERRSLAKSPHLVTYNCDTFK